VSHLSVSLIGLSRGCGGPAGKIRMEILCSFLGAAGSCGSRKGNYFDFIFSMLKVKAEKIRGSKRRKSIKPADPTKNVSQELDANIQGEHLDCHRVQLHQNAMILRRYLVWGFGGAVGNPNCGVLEATKDRYSNLLVYFPTLVYLSQ